MIRIGLTAAVVGGVGMVVTGLLRSDAAFAFAVGLVVVGLASAALASIWTDR
jgi:hypothetical protein